MDLFSKNSKLSKTTKGCYIYVILNLLLNKNLQCDYRGKYAFLELYFILADVAVERDNLLDSQASQVNHIPDNGIWERIFF